MSDDGLLGEDDEREGEEDAEAIVFVPYPEFCGSSGALMALERRSQNQSFRSCLV